MTARARSLREALDHRVEFRTAYERSDPIAATRARWRARTMRTLAELGPSSRVLELLPGQGLLTDALHEAAGDGCRIDTLGVDELVASPSSDENPGGYDAVVGIDLLDVDSAAVVLRHAYSMLSPGGTLVFVESNPWNPMLRLRRALGLGRDDARNLPNRTHLYELLSDVGFVQVFAVYSDFVFPPLSRRAMWLLRNASLLLQNTPGVRRFAGSIVVAGRRPPRRVTHLPHELADEPHLVGQVSVVVPCHDEEANVARLVGSLDALYGPYVHEFVLVDDCSTDRTGAILDELAAADSRVVAVHRQPPGGVGRALRDGYARATGEWVLSMDCDFEHLLGDLRDVFAGAHDCDVVIGSRFTPDSVLLRYPLPKIVSNRAFHLVARATLGVRFRDVTNNLKLMRREVVDALNLCEDGFAANAETGLLPLLGGYRVREVPISWIDRDAEMGHSSFSLGRVGDGYVRVLWHATQWRRRGQGRYGDRRSAPTASSTLR